MLFVLPSFKFDLLLDARCSEGVNANAQRYWFELLSAGGVPG